MQGKEEMDGTETATDNALSGEETVANITLGTEPNDPLDSTIQRDTIYLT